MCGLYRPTQRCSGVGVSLSLTQTVTSSSEGPGIGWKWYARYAYIHISIFRCGHEALIVMLSQLFCLNGAGICVAQVLTYLLATVAVPAGDADVVSQAEVHARNVAPYVTKKHTDGYLMIK